MIRSAETGPISQAALRTCPTGTDPPAGRKTLPSAGKTRQASAAGEGLSLPLLYTQGQQKAPRRQLPPLLPLQRRGSLPRRHTAPTAPENPLLRVLWILGKKSPSRGAGSLLPRLFPTSPSGTGPTHEGFASQGPARPPRPASSGPCPAHWTAKPTTGVREGTKLPNPTKSPRARRRTQKGAT